MIIEDDPKIRNQMLQLLAEMGIEEVKDFSSIADFEKVYYSSLTQKPKLAPVAGKNPLDGFHADYLKFLNGAKFASEPAFKSEKAEIELNADKTQILKFNVTQFIGQTVTDILTKAITLESLVVPEAKPRLKSFLEALDKGEKDKVESLAFKNEKNELCIAEVRGALNKENKSYILTLVDQTLIFAKALGKIGGEKEKASLPANKPVDVIIFRYDLVPNKTLKPWVTKTSALLQKASLWPATGRPKFIALRYEGDAREKADFNHPFIDDLLCAPLDRLIFLQKVEIALNLPKKTSPSHLFVQETNEKIEIAKRMQLERISDLGFAMANPFALSPGTLGHFYFRFPGQKPLLDVYAKVLMSERHPERPDESLVYFSFFGMSKLINREVKKYLNRDTAYKNLIDQDPNAFEYNPENIFVTEEQKVKKTVAILDFDEAIQKSLTGYLRKEIGNLDVVFDDTYYGFFRRYLDKGSASEKSVTATNEDFFVEIVSFLVGANDLAMQMPITVPGDEDRLLGHVAKTIFGSSQGWLDLFTSDGRNLLTECLHLVQSTKRINKNMDLKTPEGKPRTVAVELILEEGNGVVRINLRPPDLRSLATAGQLQKIESLDVVIADSSLVPEDPTALIAGLKKACDEANIRTGPNGPRLIVMGEEDRRIDFEKLSRSSAFGFVYKPIEIRRLLFLVGQALETPFTIYRFDNIGWKKDVISAKIARDAKITEISEFGAIVLSEQPLKPGTMLYLFRSIYQNAPDQNLCVRVYFSEEDSSTKGSYLNSIIYFGITDAFLKYIRAYIRETYASKKAKESGGT